MALQTCAVTCVMHGQDGQPEAGATFEAKLNRFEIYQGYVVPEVVRGTADENGVCVLNLWPNQLGATESLYDVKMRSTSGRSLTVQAVVPSELTANLHEISLLPPFPGKLDGQVQLESAIEASQVALAARDATIVARDATLVAATEADADRVSAETAATTATTQAGISTTKAAEAAGHEAASFSSKNAAELARDQAQAAKVDAESARDAAQTAKGDAEAAAATATSQATASGSHAANADADRIAAESARIAAETARNDALSHKATAEAAATTATEQATIATAKAAAAATFDPALFVPRSGGVTLTGPLSVPAGASGAQVPQAQETYGPKNGQLAGMRNKIINGAFGINQRGYVSGAATTAGQYTLDRWNVTGTGGVTFSTTANKTTVTIPSGQTIQQVIEGLNLQTGTYVLSWEGTAQGRIAGGAYGASGAVTASITGGTNTTIEFAAGTVANVQLELGTIATPFEHRPYGAELALCQRYYEAGGFFHVGYVSGATNLGSTVKFSVVKRASPTLVQTNTSNSNCSPTPGNASTGAPTESFLSFRTGLGSGPAQFAETWTVSAEL